MTSPENEGSAPKKIEHVPTIFEFPANPTRIPIYANTCLVNVSTTDVYVDFGFLDTYPASPDKTRVDSFGKTIVTVTPVTRVSLNLQAARLLQSQLNNLFNVLNYPDGNNNDTKD